VVNRVTAAFRQAFKIWHKDNPALLSAGISYFTLFSIVPAFVISIALAGHVFETYVPKQRIFGEIANLFNPEAAAAVQTMLFAANKSAAPATFFGILLLIWGASRAFWSLQSALNIIWGVADKPRKVHHFVMDRVKALLMIVGAGLLFAIFFALDLSLTFVRRHLRVYLPHLAVRLFVVSTSYALFLGLFTLLFAMTFKFLPDVHITWKDVWAGAFVSAILFALARYLIALYFLFSMMATVYGAAGSVIVLLVWIYFSTQILLFGAAFARAWSRPVTTLKIL